MNKKQSFLQKMIGAPYIIWAAIFIIVPMIIVVYYAFTDPNGSFTFDNIIKLMEPNYSSSIVRSISFAFISTIICLIMSFPISYIISQMKGNSQKTLILLVMLPMWMNLLLRTYSWMNILEPVGLIGTPYAVILGMVYNFIPYMIMPIYSVMTKIDKTVIEAASDLGCNKFKVLMKVVLPLSKPGVISGIIMVFVPSVSTFYISQKLGGGTFDLIGDQIERQFQTNNNYNFGSALSLLLMVLILICMAVMNKFTDSDNGGELII